MVHIICQHYFIVCNIVQKKCLTVLVDIVTNMDCQINRHCWKCFKIVQNIVCNIVFIITVFVNIVWYCPQYCSNIVWYCLQYCSNIVSEIYESIVYGIATYCSTLINTMFNVLHKPESATALVHLYFAALAAKNRGTMHCWHFSFDLPMEEMTSDWWLFEEMIRRD